VSNVNASQCPACGAPLPEEASLRGFDRLHGTSGAVEVRICDACGTGRTFPLVSSDALSAFYPASYGAHAPPAGTLARLLVRRRYSRALRRHPLCLFRRGPAGRLLDVGAGSGDLGASLASLGWTVVGVEPSAEACIRGSRRGLEMIEGTLETADPDELGSTYDAVVFQHSLEHVVEPAQDLARAHALLRDGGLLAVSVPNFGSWQSRAFGSAWLHLDLPRHRTHFTAAGLERLLRRSGFEDVALATATTPDGLPMSLEYCTFGRRRSDGGPVLYLSVLLSLALVLPSVFLNAFTGGGDELGAAAVKTAAR
jgi:SAM-dependent methyltransferase